MTKRNQVSAKFLGRKDGKLLGVYGSEKKWIEVRQDSSIDTQNYGIAKAIIQESMLEISDAATYIFNRQQKNGELVIETNSGVVLFESVHNGNTIELFIRSVKIGQVA